jgi:hypothetical protein
VDLIGESEIAIFPPMGAKNNLAHYLEREGGASRANADQIASNLLRRGRSHVAEMFTNLGAQAQAEADDLAARPPRPPGPMKKYFVKGFWWWDRFIEDRNSPQ